jgi:maltooligosyltrehalose trehalohydrolase
MQEMDFSNSSPSTPHFSLTLGATQIADTLTRFRVWAPKAKNLSVQIIQRRGNQETVVQDQPLERDKQGVFSGVVADCATGALYRYQLDGKPGRPDPMSRFQPYGVHGPSQVIDPNRFLWTDQNWQGVKKRDLIIYELHVGSFTEEGTYQAAIAKLDELKQLGITAIELLPIGQTPGRWNWGYDGVNYFAPRNTFGNPDDLKAFIDACHARQISVILDVVYNHVGPEGNYLNEFGYYRSKKHATPWGDALNFDGSGNRMVREFVVSNVLFWIEEYHFDGMRLDAIHYMFDDSEVSIVEEVRARFREYAATIDREIYLIAESNIYDPHLLADEKNYDAIWSDCLMHSIYSHGNPEVRLTDRHYAGTRDLVEALEHAYVFSVPQAMRVGEADRLRHHPNGERDYIESLVMALQTHDSVGNHPHGKRLHQLTCLDFQRAAAPLILLYPSIPMIFMGEEWATDAPFPFFADFEDPGLRQAVDQGRRHEYPYHDWTGTPLPSDPQAFLDSKSKTEHLNVEMHQWYSQLLALRKKGIAAGWLEVKNFTTEHDPDHDLFKLIYNGPAQKVVICSRLAAPDADVVMLRDVTPTESLLDSQQENSGKSSSPFEFVSRHCRIWIESK